MQAVCSLVVAIVPAAKCSVVRNDDNVDPHGDIGFRPAEHIIVTNSSLSGWKRPVSHITRHTPPFSSQSNGPADTANMQVRGSLHSDWPTSPSPVVGNRRGEGWRIASAPPSTYPNPNNSIQISQLTAAHINNALLRRKYTCNPNHRLDR